MRYRDGLDGVEAYCRDNGITRFGPFVKSCASSRDEAVRSWPGRVKSSPAFRVGTMARIAIVRRQLGHAARKSGMKGKRG